MKIVCIGGGPAGLYFALLMKKQDPRHDITVVERNKPYDTFGWGVVFSDQTLGNLQAADPQTASEILGAFNHWDDIEVNIRGHKVRSGGHGFCGSGRKRLLNILQERCLALGVKLVFETDATDDQAIAAQYNADLVIARRAAPANCAAGTIIDANALARGGVQWLRWDEARGSFEVRPAIPQVSRPWRAALP